MSIIVLTHNGKLPKDGGLRRGYQAGNRVFIFGGPAEGISLKDLMARQAPAKAIESRQKMDSEIIDYWNLRSMDFDGLCPHCWTRLLHPEVEKETNRGHRTLQYCERTDRYLIRY